MLNLLLITICIVFVVDLSGFSESLKLWVSGLLSKGKLKTTNYSLKPFTCSLCLTFWVGIGYLWYASLLTLPYIAVVCLLAFVTDTIKGILLLIKDLTSKVITIIYKYLNL